MPTAFGQSAPPPRPTRPTSAVSTDRAAETRKPGDTGPVRSPTSGILCTVFARVPYPPIGRALGAAPLGRRQSLSQSRQAAEDQDWRASENEFVNGVIIAMGGASPEHCYIQSDLHFAVVSRLRGRTCRAFLSNQRVRIDETGLYAYPDMSVVCGKARFSGERPACLLNPLGSSRATAAKTASRRCESSSTWVGCRSRFATRSASRCGRPVMARASVLGAVRHSRRTICSG